MVLMKTANRLLDHEMHGFVAREDRSVGEDRIRL
jgi:hypothetical protein